MYFRSQVKTFQTIFISSSRGYIVYSHHLLYIFIRAFTVSCKDFYRSLWNKLEKKYRKYHIQIYHVHFRLYTFKTCVWVSIHSHVHESAKRRNADWHCWQAILCSYIRIAEGKSEFWWFCNLENGVWSFWSVWALCNIVPLFASNNFIFLLKKAQVAMCLFTLKPTIEEDYYTNLDDKRDDLTFSIVNFPFISINIPASSSNGVYISQLVRYSRACLGTVQWFSGHSSADNAKATQTKLRNYIYNCSWIEVIATKFLRSSSPICLTVKKHPYLKWQWIFDFLRRCFLSSITAMTCTRLDCIFLDFSLI